MDDGIDRYFSVIVVGSNLAKLDNEEILGVIQAAKKLTEVDQWVKDERFLLDTGAGKALALKRIEAGDRKLLLEMVAYNLGGTLYRIPPSERDAFIDEVLEQANNPLFYSFFL
ncbi:MAG: hypothetical protein HGB08_00770 [Candidatus Moranbacteria bacterium]|nr:hypothetical protein [Candidatus Moranbacteria bacterium]